eukprot:gb/GEZN01010440.1/.p1 GENE.gb/GEZN01010440.1/~~gb/GEZN01010440.1/.p1  ORF type:complete len:335 (+),score=49.06 gb/GEZN01010440.1/:72-1076(+)
MDWALAGKSFFWGFISAISLPLGALIALAWDFSDQVIALSIAYGGGALLFALSVEIYAEALKVEERKAGQWELSLMIWFSVIGALLFLWAKKRASLVTTSSLSDFGERSYLQYEEEVLKSSSMNLKTPPNGGTTSGDSSQTSPATAATAPTQHRQVQLHLLGHQRTGHALDRRVDSSSAQAIWMGIALDSVPESMVIGFLTLHGNMSFGFLVGVFLSNFPEAVAASMLMKGAMHWSRVLFLWTAVAISTGLGAMFTTIIFPHSEEGEVKWVEFVQAGAEGLAGGAMLCMISAAALPEAYERGGDKAGLFCVLGFLTALVVQAYTHIPPEFCACP